MVEAKFELRFFFDAGARTCVWAQNDAAHDQFGYAIDCAQLPISPELAADLEALTVEYDLSIDWDNPAGDSPWNSSQIAAFSLKAARILETLKSALGSSYSVIDEIGPI
jgi:hypothetical protein